LEKGQVVQVVLNNADSGRHPFHLHGHTFQLIDRSIEYDNPVSYDSSNHSQFPAIPMRRDTVVVRPNGNFVLRFIADNPGVWFFHCHIEWHLSQGLALTFIEAPNVLQQQLTIPQQHIDVCQAAGIPFKGNAAANEQDLLDLVGQNSQQPWLPAGFTARGIVALVFSCISAFLGMGSIAWYGMSDLSVSQKRMLSEEGVNPDNDDGNDGEDEEPTRD
jgi:iron transport multicopper oxidase